MARRRFLIVAGLPKAGTTFLYAQFGRHPEYFVPPAGNKEIDYLRAGADFGQYLAKFETGDGVHVDSSPLYFDDIVTTADNIAACLQGQELMIVVCLRHPLERMFSHYLHDVAQNFSVYGHGPYSLYTPQVMAKYLLATAGRIRHLQDRFGAGRVFGFAFGADISRFETALRDYAGLPADWAFDYGQNPAPGFTAPRLFYDPDRDTAVSLRDGLFRLPARQLLVVNRQFSQLLPRVAPKLAERLVRNQHSVDRVFDPGRLSQENRAAIAADFAEACDLLSLSLPPEDQERLLIARSSDELSEPIRKRLDRIGSLDEAVADILANPLRASDETILSLPEPEPGFASTIAAMNQMSRGKGDGSLTMAQHLERIEAGFGLAPQWLNGLAQQYLHRRDFARLEQLLAPYGGGAGLLRPVDLRPVQDRVRPPLTPPEIARLKAAGYLVDDPPGGS